eukprot:PITA_06541
MSFIFVYNLDMLIKDLVMNASQTGFCTSSYGEFESPNKIYGLLQCSGDILSQQDCSNCSWEAVRSLRQTCGNSTGGQVMLDSCFLRYGNSSFFSELEIDGFYLANINNMSTNYLQNFTSTAFNLLSNLSEAYVCGNNEFAKERAPYSSVGTVYGRVQCWRYISMEECRYCLEIARSNLHQCCSMKQRAQALLESCTVRYEIYAFFNTSPASPPKGGDTSPAIPPKGGAQTPRRNDTSSSPKRIEIILGVVGCVLLALGIGVFALRRKLKSAVISARQVTRAQNEGIHEHYSESTLLKNKQVLFRLESLIESTDNFHESNKLGGGGFGSVYKGKAEDGKQIAVKRLSVRSSQGNEEFMNEVNVLANVRHRNLVKLLGCCAEGPERLIVYEYLPNKSLHTRLFDPDEHGKLLDWQTRCKIIMGIAGGLRYLHEESEPRIIHRDIKANNILLDKTLNPKIADFGLARLFPEDKSHIQTRVAGTYGYMAPEYAMRGQLSMKADVYSFGVLVLEIVSGRKISDADFPQETQSLLEWAWRLYKHGQLLNMIDSTVRETCRVEQAVRCIHVALLCTQADAGIRPSISNVIMMISSCSETLPNPKKPTFFKTSESNLGGSRESQASSVSTASPDGPLVPSINNVTITELEAR